MSAGRTVLHLVREPRLPAALGEPTPGDTIVFLAGPPTDAPPPPGSRVLGASRGGVRGIDAGDLVDLAFAHDVVQTW